MTATTALTAQNTLGVDDVHITPPTFVGKQIHACLTDIPCDVVKIGEFFLLLPVPFDGSGPAGGVGLG